MAEKDPNRLRPGDPGCKMDDGKLMLDLLLDFKKALRAVGEVATYGAKKYSRGGWKTVDKGYERYTAAMLRHLLADIPDDSGIDHDYMVAWNALARLELKLGEKKAGETEKETPPKAAASAVEKLAGTKSHWGRSITQEEYDPKN